MCLGAIYWARLDRIYFGCNQQDAAQIGFDDALIYEELRRPLAERQIPIVGIDRSEAVKAFDAWRVSGNRIEY